MKICALSQSNQIHKTCSALGCASMGCPLFGNTDKKIIEAGRVIELMEAQKFLHDELGSDWNDLLKTVYEGRILAAMYKFKHSHHS